MKKNTEELWLELMTLGQNEIERGNGIVEIGKKLEKLSRILGALETIGYDRINHMEFYSGNELVISFTENDETFNAIMETAKKSIIEQGNILKGTVYK